MKASELVDKINEIIKNKGDMDVDMFDWCYNDLREIHTIEIMNEGQPYMQYIRIS